MVGLPLAESIRCRLLAGLCIWLARARTDGGVDEVAQQALGGFGLAIEKEVDRFVEHGVREGGVVLYAQRNGFLEVAGEGHVSSCAGLMPCAFCSFPTVRWHDRCLSVGAFMSLV